MLTVAQIRGLKPKDKPYKKSDGRGLYIIVNPNGSRWWRFKYQFGGREKLLSLGTFPDTSLKFARGKCDEMRKLLAGNINPSTKRQAEKIAQDDTFEAIAREWLKLTGNPKSGSLMPGTVEQLRRRLEKYVFPSLGQQPIADIKPADLLKTLRRIESRGTHETAHRVRSLCGRIFRFAIATGRAERDVAADLQGARAPVKSQNFAAITEPKRIGELLRAIDGYQGQPVVMTALKLAPLLFVRPGELRAAVWAELDLDAAEWRIPAERTKMGKSHLVPLSNQSVALLKEIHASTGNGTFVFPSLRSCERPISDNTLNAALRRLGYSQEEMTAHGFRTMASTRLNEMGYPPDVIELQLGHTERNKVRAAYNRAQRLTERCQMMQTWADYLDGLRKGENNRVTSIRCTGA